MSDLISPKGSYCTPSKGVRKREHHPSDSPIDKLNASRGIEIMRPDRTASIPSTNEYGSAQGTLIVALHSG